jgi:hypothetical protein
VSVPVGGWHHVFALEPLILHRVALARRCLQEFSKALNCYSSAGAGTSKHLHERADDASCGRLDTAAQAPGGEFDGSITGN